jgi:hypothetical protein
MAIRFFMTVPTLIFLACWLQPQFASRTVRAKPGTAHGRMIRALYLGWVGKYNVGDDAVYIACAEALTQAFASRGIHLMMSPFYPPTAQCGLFDMEINYMDFIVLGLNASRSIDWFSFHSGGGSILSREEYRYETFNIGLLCWILNSKY